MTVTVEEKKVGDITITELKNIIRDTPAEILDPDYRLELRSEVVEELKLSLKSKEKIPVEDVVWELGLVW